MEEKIKKLMAEVFVCDVNEINDTTTQNDLENWDSLQHLMFASKLEEEFKIKFSPKEINSMTEFRIIHNLIKSKLGNEV